MLVWRPCPRPGRRRAETEAKTARTRLAELGTQVQESRTALGQLASDSYVSGGGPLGDVAAVLMSLAYQAQSGSALCVTDSYRSYAEQVAVKRKLPGLAATAGTSKHGLGLAVDLCGGVQSFGTPAHQWMKRHGPLFGWFHPAWSEPSGGLPEPWHWEFAG